MLQPTKGCHSRKESDKKDYSIGRKCSSYLPEIYDALNASEIVAEDQANVINDGKGVKSFGH